MESIGDESSSLEITPDLGTEESTARDKVAPSQGGHQPLLLLLQSMEMVFTGADRLLLLRSCRVTAMSHRPLRSLLTWDVILPSDPCMCLSPPIRWVQQLHNTWNKLFLSANIFLSCVQLYKMHKMHKSRSNRKASEEMAMAFPRLGGWMDGICNLRLQSHKHIDLFGSYTHSTPCGASCYALKHTSKQKTIKKHIYPPRSIQMYLKPETMISKIVLIAFFWGEKELSGWIQWSYERNAVG